MWLSGIRLSIDAVVIADRSSLGQVFIGLVLLVLALCGFTLVALFLMR